MNLPRIVFTAALLMCSAAAFPGALAADPPAMGAMGGHGMMRGMFTPEERMMLFVDGFKATAGMTDDQKKAYRDERRAKIMAMSEADRAKMKADLDTRWAALPADQKASITAKMEAFRAAHANGGGGMGH
jgi:hypothetical protein